MGTNASTGTIAAQDTNVGGMIAFNDATTGTLQTGAVTSSTVFTNTVTGVVSNAGNITLATAGALTLNQAVTNGALGASGTVRLQAAGDITQVAAGIITANNLGVFDSAGNITLDQANVVGTIASAGTIAAQDPNGGGTIVFKDTTTGTLQTGVVASSSVFTNTVTGIASNAGNITLATAGALTLNQAVTTGSGASSTVRLQAAGDITQAAAGTITALNLGVFDSAGNITLDQANVVGTNASTGTIAAQDINAGGTIVFKDSTTGTLQTGVVAASGVFTNTVTGVASNAGNVTLATAGRPDAKPGSHDGLWALPAARCGCRAAGDVTQVAAGIITANNLGVFDSAGNITLDQANVVGTNASAGTIAAQDTSAGGTIVFKDTTTGTLQTGVVASSSVFTTTVTGIASNAGNITLATAGALTLNQAVTTGSGASSTVRLRGGGRHHAGGRRNHHGQQPGGLRLDRETSTLAQANVVGDERIDGNDCGTGHQCRRHDRLQRHDDGNIANRCRGVLGRVCKHGHGSGSSNAGNITLATAGALTLNQAVTTGSGASSTVRWVAGGRRHHAGGRWHRHGQQSGGLRLGGEHHAGSGQRRGNERFGGHVRGARHRRGNPGNDRVQGYDNRDFADWYRRVLWHLHEYSDGSGLERW